MKITFSNHAEKRMRERNILKPEVVDAILNPDKSGQKEHEYFAIKTRKNGQLLITYYIDKEEIVHVITVISTSKKSKYLK